jgi:hypothetical protein
MSYVVAREIIFLIILSIIAFDVNKMNNDIWKKGMVLVIVIQIITHVLLATGKMKHCNPKHGSKCANNIALSFGLIYLFVGFKFKKWYLVLAGLYISISHLTYINLFNANDDLTIRNEEMMSISVVTLNYKRPDNVIRQITELLKYPSIKEIIIGHGDNEAKMKVLKGLPKSKKIKHVNDNGDLGGAIRFYVARDHVSHDKVLFLDDDVIPSRQLLFDMAREVVSKKLVGPIARECNSSVGSNNKLYYLILSQLLGVELAHDIILTPIMMTTKDVLDRIMVDFEFHRKTLIVNRGNGEDILFNKIFSKVYKMKPSRVDGNYRWLDFKTASYHGSPGFQSQRDKLCAADV